MHPKYLIATLVAACIWLVIMSSSAPAGTGAVSRRAVQAVAEGPTLHEAALVYSVIFWIVTVLLWTASTRCSAFIASKVRS